MIKNSDIKWYIKKWYLKENLQTIDENKNED
jgi:hypothetical protein